MRHRDRLLQGHTQRGDAAKRRMGDGHPLAARTVGDNDFAVYGPQVRLGIVRHAAACLEVESVPVDAAGTFVNGVDLAALRVVIGLMDKHPLGDIRTASGAVDVILRDGLHETVEVRRGLLRAQNAVINSVNRIERAASAVSIVSPGRDGFTAPCSRLSLPSGDVRRRSLCRKSR